MLKLLPFSIVSIPILIGLDNASISLSLQSFMAGTESLTLKPPSIASSDCLIFQLEQSIWGSFFSLIGKKSASFVDLKERIFSKVISWKAILLSQAARTTLIKYVANAIPSYITSIFLLPKFFCLEINSILRKFWWGFP
jgi:hypothetical protein